jgi:integrase
MPPSPNRLERKHGKDRVGVLTNDEDLRRWYDDLAHGARKTADNYTRTLSRFCERIARTPKDYIGLDTKIREDLLQDEIARLTLEDKTSEARNVKKAVVSWLAHNGLRLNRRIRLPRIQERKRNRRQATPEELRATLRASDARARAAISLLALGGQREETLGNYGGTDGLRIRDVVDAHIDKATGYLAFDRIPVRIVVRPSLSKVGHTYFFFLGPEAVGYLDGYMRNRLADGEKLTLESALITMGPQQNRPYRGTGKQFIRTINIADMIRKPMRAAGIVDLTPYAWRAYYSSRTMLCRALTIEIRDFLQGHKGGIAQVYSTNRELPPDIVEAMRNTYTSALQYLETTGQPVNPRVEALKALLLPFGYNDKELSESGVDELLAMIEKEVQRLQAQVMVPTIKGVDRPAQRVVPNTDLPNLFEAGWTFKASLGDGKSVVEAPQGGRADFAKTDFMNRTSEES